MSAGDYEDRELFESDGVHDRHYQGVGAAAGIAVGRAFIVDRRRVRTPKYHLEPDAIEGEILRLETALKLSEHQLDHIYEKLKADGAAGEEHLLILEAHRLMLRDEMLVTTVRHLIHEDAINAEWAIRRTVRKIKKIFDDIDHEYFRERRGDVDFVGDRIVRNLMGQVVDVDEAPPEDAVVVAHDLSPADTVVLGRFPIQGIVTDVGTATSHSAIVARALGIPAVVGCGDITERAGQGDVVVVDGTHGVAIVTPTPDEIDSYRRARNQHLAQEKALLANRDLPAETTDGHRVHLYGNIEFTAEVPVVCDHGGEGIGLYRTEFLYLGRRDLPSEEEHYRAYAEILTALSPRPVTIRTFDLGGDKVPYTGRRQEPNPAMGLRALRLCLKEPEILHTQLRAMLRASVHGNLSIMFPMVSGLSELRWALALVDQFRAELQEEGQEVSPAVKVGSMIELPSAVAVADQLARECDFFSIGTNDLIQYSLGIDRQNRDVAYLYRPLHLAVLRMIKQVVDAGKDAGIPVAICGEMAGEPALTPILLGLGVDRLSMTAATIPLVKHVVRSVSLSECKELVEQACALGTVDEIERFVRDEVQARFPDLLT
ncbi:MAG: phosphoenolpyruvate--protein phosphotransferase [Deltaproteobacteria bacterium]|nr:phosphoenolpyruvate--protein phosphotransferase [Deltaproteobacteria bacterium]